MGALRAAFHPKTAAAGATEIATARSNSMQTWWLIPLVLLLAALANILKEQYALPVSRVVYDDSLVEATACVPVATPICRVASAAPRKHLFEGKLVLFS